MRRTIVLSTVVSSLVSVVVTLLVMTLAVPAIVEAQETRSPILVETGPGIRGRVGVVDASGTVRVVMATGGREGTSPEAAGINLFASDGTQVGRLGAAGRQEGGSLRTNLILSDRQGNQRLIAAVDEDGTPWIRFYDASGNVTWSAR